MLKFLHKNLQGFFLRLSIKKHHISRWMMVFVFLILLVLGVWYWLYSQNYVTTDDAYVKANVVQIAPQIGGKVINVAVVDNAFVHQNQLLFQIDPAPFLIEVNRAQAQLEKDSATLENAMISTTRIFTLARKHFLSQQEQDDFVEKLKSAKAMVKLDQADLNHAQLNLQYTNVTAPTDGWITNLSLRPGDSVNVAEPVFALVSNRDFWVEANVKETDFEHLKTNQKATIILDMYPGHSFNGVVDSLSRGSGEVFSLLPPENATGNWVKVTQRVPVKIRFIDPDPSYPLRIGVTASVKIDLHSTRTSNEKPR